MGRNRSTRMRYESGITRFERGPGPSWLRPAAVIVVGLVLLSVLIPALRVGLLFWSSPFRDSPSKPHGLATQSVHFHASDGVALSGWFVPASPKAPSIVLIPGFKDDRSTMVPYARFLHAAGINVLLYDGRGTGGSSGTFSLGLREVNDVRGAMRYLSQRSDHRVGLLGVSLGAGVAIVAAARLPAIGATVADSAYVDQTALVDRLDELHAGPLTIPLAPVAPWLVDQILGKPLKSFSPLRAVPNIAPRALYLIHSWHDSNPTTPLKGAEKLYHAAGQPVFLWIAPRGGHAGALAAQRQPYEQSVIQFYRRYLGR